MITNDTDIFIEYHNEPINESEKLLPYKYKLHISLTYDSYQSHREKIKEIIEKYMNSNAIDCFKEIKPDTVRDKILIGNNLLDSTNQFNKNPFAEDSMTHQYNFHRIYQRFYERPSFNLDKNNSKKIEIDLNLILEEISRFKNGDQFTIYIPEPHEKNNIANLCKEINTYLENNNASEGKCLNVSSSLGKYINFRQEYLSSDFDRINQQEIEDYNSRINAISLNDGNKEKIKKVVKEQEDSNLYKFLRKETNPSIPQKFQSYCISGDLQEIEQYLLKNKNTAKNLILEQDENGNNALHYAARSSNVEIIKILLSYFTAKELEKLSNKDGQHPVHHAFEQPGPIAVEIVKEFFKKGISMDLKTIAGITDDGYPTPATLRTFLHTAVHHKHVEGVLFLLHAFSNPGISKEIRSNFLNARDFTGYTSLVQAINLGYSEIAFILFEHSGYKITKPEMDALRELQEGKDGARSIEINSTISQLYLWMPIAAPRRNSVLAPPQNVPSSLNSEEEGKKEEIFLELDPGY